MLYKKANGRLQWFLSLHSTASSLRGETTARGVVLSRWSPWKRYWHFASNDCLQNSLARTLAHLHITHETTRISWESSKFFFFPIPVKSIKGRYFKSEDDSLHEITSKIDSYIERKLSLSLIFRHHCLPSYAQVFYHFFFLIVSLNDWQRLLQKRETRQIFMPTRIRSRIFQSRHVVMLDHVMLIVSRIYNFQKLKCSEL